MDRNSDQQPGLVGIANPVKKGGSTTAREETRPRGPIVGPDLLFSLAHSWFYIKETPPPSWPPPISHFRLLLAFSRLRLFPFNHCKFRPELANSVGTISLEEEADNKRVVLALYEALSSGDVDTVQRLLAPDIEWWFHGPPSCQYMMRLLTGATTRSAAGEDPSFDFVPLTVQAFGPTVLAEGRFRSLSWVHAWTVTDGIITQVREYFNTSLTVTRLHGASSSSSRCFRQTLWESSSVSDSSGTSMPGLVLAI